MTNNYWVHDWAMFRRDEIIRIPQEYNIHKDFTVYAGEDDVKAAFSQLNSLCSDIYGDIAQSPEDFGMPMHLKDEYRVFSKQWNDSGQAPYRPFILLYHLFICGDISGNAITVSTEKFRGYKPPPKHLSGIEQKITNPHLLFNKLADYGFVFEGLRSGKPASSEIVISYPDNADLLILFKLLADKARNTNHLADFLCCSFRLMQNDMHTAEDDCVADLADKVHTSLERDFVRAMDETLVSMGLIREPRGGYEGPGLAYHRSKSKPYSFRMVARSPDITDFSGEKMLLGLRIRNVENCMEYLNVCPDSVKQIFTSANHPGCEKRVEKLCKHGVEYKIDGKNYWRCGCCHTPFNVKPNVKDIPHYIKLVELGEKK